jgi:hypothetical protein
MDVPEVPTISPKEMLDMEGEAMEEEPIVRAEH